MEKISEDTLELGNLLFGHSRGEYAISRENWQDVFCDFLESCGFDSYGYAKDSLEKYVKTYYAPAYYYSETDISAEELRKNGTLKNSDNTYEYNGKTYEIREYVEDKYYNDWSEWLDSEEEDEDKFFAEEPKVSDYKTEEEVYEINEVEEHQHYFDNETFVVRPYFWGEAEEIFKLPNFLYKPTGFAIQWYKYPLRDSYCNQDISDEEFKDILAKCKDSLK